MLHQQRNPCFILYPARACSRVKKTKKYKRNTDARTTSVDVMIVGRGGGSITERIGKAFNEESCVQFFECSFRSISAVGHETDVTIADFVADCELDSSAAAKVAGCTRSRM